MFRVIAQKIGYAGEDEPRYVFPTVVGHPTIGSEKYRKPAPPTCRDEEYVSKDDVEVIKKISRGGAQNYPHLGVHVGVPLHLTLTLSLSHILNLSLSLCLLKADHVNHTMGANAHSTLDDGGWVHPVSRGRVVDWAAMEKVIGHGGGWWWWC